MHIGFDIGGTKLAAIGLDDDGQERARFPPTGAEELRRCGRRGRRYGG